MMDKLAALDGAVIQGGPITVRPNLSEREANGVDTRAAVLACLLAAPAGMTEWAIMKAVGLTTGGIASALESLTDECPALREAPGRRGAILYLDREEWQLTGWRAGGVCERRFTLRSDRQGIAPDWTGGYLPTARVTRRDGRLRVAV